MLANNIINYQEFYFEIKPNRVPDNNFRPYLTIFQIIAQNMKINLIVVYLAKKLYQSLQFIRKAASEIN